MRKKWAVILPIIIISVSVFITYAFDTGDGTPYTSSSTGKEGVSLLFDTLKYMDYNVRISRRPIMPQVNINDVYIVVQPRRSVMTPDAEREMLEWVKNGGRLILLESGHRFIDAQSESIENGQIITGNVLPILNGSLMKDAYPGHMLQIAIERWNTERTVETIYFAEYYLGNQSADTLFGKLPLVVRLVFIQMAILAVIVVWHLGKRFGNPIHYYEEVEREENEYIRALARLYMETERKRRNK